MLKQGKVIKGGNVASSSHIVDKKVWNIIWSMKIPNKVKIFLWKCCVDAIPCCDELWKKKVRKNPNCIVCGEGKETIEHVLLLCEWTKGYGLVLVQE